MMVYWKQIHVMSFIMCIMWVLKTLLAYDSNRFSENA